MAQRVIGRFTVTTDAPGVEELWYVHQLDECDGAGRIVERPRPLQLTAFTTDTEAVAFVVDMLGGALVPASGSYAPEIPFTIAPMSGGRVWRVERTDTGAAVADAINEAQARDIVRDIGGYLADVDVPAVAL